MNIRRESKKEWKKQHNFWENLDISLLRTILPQIHIKPLKEE